MSYRNLRFSSTSADADTTDWYEHPSTGERIRIISAPLVRDVATGEVYERITPEDGATSQRTTWRTVYNWRVSDRVTGEDFYVWLTWEDKKQASIDRGLIFDTKPYGKVGYRHVHTQEFRTVSEHKSKGNVATAYMGGGMTAPETAPLVQDTDAKRYSVGRPNRIKRGKGTWICPSGNHRVASQGRTAHINQR